MRTIRSVLILLLFTALFWGIRSALPEKWDAYFWGADGWFMADLVKNNPFPLYYRSLLTVIIHKLVYLSLSPLGIDGWNAIAISSSLAGAIATVALWKINRNRWFLVINILSGSFIVFVGHVENYAWVNTFLILSIGSVQKNLEARSRLWPAFTYLMLACLSHMLAVFYFPAFAYLLWKKRQFDPREILIPFIVFLSLLVILSVGFDLLGTDVGLERLVPIGHVWAKNQYFTLFSFDHLAILCYFHFRAAFLGIPLELPLLFFFRKRINSDFLRFLFACTLCGLIWTTLWHPDWGRLDWDLFSQFGIPLHILLGLLVQPVCQHSMDKKS